MGTVGHTDSTVSELDELLALTRQFRGQLQRRIAHGGWAAPNGPSPRPSFTPAPAPDLEQGSDREPIADELVTDSVPQMLAEVGAAALRAPIAEHGSPALRTPGTEIGDVTLRDPVPEIDVPVESLTRLGRRTLAQIRADLGECTRCKLHSTRKSIVFGVGPEDAPLMFVGEAPGEQEDRRGEPFVGRAGELLDKMIEAMGWTRDAVWIGNTLKCRPPGNRNPQPDELAQCMPFLKAQITAVAPRIIIALGRPAANQLLESDAPISALRGKFHDRHGTKVMPTFHPAYLLREPDRKRDAWADLKLVMAELERIGIEPPRPPR